MDSWCDLQKDLLEIIIENHNLSILDVVRLSSVCSWWRKIVKGLEYFRGPLLVLPASDDDDGDDNHGNQSNSEPWRRRRRKGLRFLSVKNGMHVSYTADKNLGKLFDGGVCVGSSHEWLFVVDKRLDLWLLNLFSGKQIQLPNNNEVFPHISDDEEEQQEEEGDEIGRLRRALVSSREPVLHWRIPIEKAVLSASPSYDKNYKVVIIYGYEMKLAYCGGHGEGGGGWTLLCDDKKYCDAVWEGDMLYALTQEQFVVAWDFKQPKPSSKRKIFSPSYNRRVEVFPYDALQFYLAISKGDILLIHRYIGDRVNWDGQIVDEGTDLPPNEDGDYNNHPPVFPYRTLEFRVFRRDLKERTWVKVVSLEDEAIFLGGNQTLSLSARDYPGINKNSIYFTDNYWDRINEDYLYGGHDIGVYNLETRNLEMFVSSDRIEPTPFWVSIP